MSRSTLCAALCGIALILLSAAASTIAQSYPARPIRVLTPNAPGGGLDVIARMIAPALTDNLGRAVVVDNRPGASGAIAMEIAAHAAPDGYTLAIFSVSQVIYAELNKANYAMFRDFAPVSQVAASPYVLAVSAQLPANSVSEFIAYAKANPDKLGYATSGVATLQQLATELFASTVGIKLVHVPYKGVGAAFPDLIAGRTPLTISSVASLAGLLRSKLLRPLAVTTTQRTAMLPEVPTMIEAGIPGFVVTQWHGIVAPAGTPHAIIDRLHQGIARSLQQPEVAARLAADGTEAVGSSPQQFAAHMKSEREKWTAAIKQAGITMQ
jgi:tripartite-type tricarboxylate transporter receptor subunit TctC